mmetsp:Transcript_13668/g.28020  ORF Transcript_13668/g.28020 Transcript_13668/m.28020 type:complete len:341 (+) Transcript_13668:1679-2701(+)
MGQTSNDRNGLGMDVDTSTQRYVVLPLCAIGIIGSLVLYGYLQETIMTGGYTPADQPDAKPEYFSNSLFLVLLNRLAATTVAVIVILFRREVSELRPQAPLHKFFLISISNVLATKCQYDALLYVTFPTQTLAKCGKMIPVMMWGTFLSRKRYGPVDYVVGVLVAVGCTVFLTAGKIASKRAAESDSWYGLILMAGYLGADGFTSTFQEKLFSGYQMSIYNQMMYVNLCSATLSLLGLFVTRSIWPALEFVRRFPTVLVHGIVLSLSVVSGQFFITFTIKTFGALVYATIMTVRQFLQIFLSNLIFRHGMTALQWFGAIVVFGALIFKSSHKARSMPSPA